MPIRLPFPDLMTARRYAKTLDDTWRLKHRGPAAGFGPEIDGHDCYVFQRRGPEPHAYTTAIVTVAKFWGAK